MSQTKKRNFYINIGSFKLNRISLLKQSGFNILLKKLYIPQRKLDIFKESLINNKGEKPFDIYFTPIQNINTNIKLKGNNYKTNPLSEKNKIIKRHNILKKIDFNTNSLKNNLDRNNKLELYLYNNSNNNNYNNIYNTRTNLTINKLNNEVLNLPFLTNTNREQNKISKKTNIQLYKNINTSSSYNDFLPIDISSPSVKQLNNIKKYDNIFTNEKIKNTYVDILKKLKPNCSNKEIQTNISNINKKENNEKKIIHNKDLNSNDFSDETSSNDIDDIKEIENIISKSNLKKYNKNINNYQSDNYYKNDTDINKSQNILKNKNRSNFILLKGLYGENNNLIKNNYNQFYQQSKTSRNIFLKGDNSLGKKNERKNKSIYYMNNNKNFILGNNISKEYKEINKRKSLNEKDKLAPYNFKKTLIQKKTISSILDSSIELNNNNSTRKDSY